MIVATKFGSTDAAFAQRIMSLPQCWISFVKIGEIPLAEVILSDAKDQIGVVTPDAGFCKDGAALFIGGAEFWITIVELLVGKAAGDSGVLSAINATTPAITRAASGGRI